MHELKNKFKNKKILIYGYGKSGRASFNYLKKKMKFSFMMILKN